MAFNETHITRASNKELRATLKPGSEYCAALSLKFLPVFWLGLRILFWVLKFIERQAFPDTAEGEYLFCNGRLYGTRRRLRLPLQSSRHRLQVRRGHYSS